MKPARHTERDYRRLARRNLASLLRYKFLYEYGYDKGPVVVEAIVADLCELIRSMTSGFLNPAPRGPHRRARHLDPLGGKDCVER